LIASLPIGLRAGLQKRNHSSRDTDRKNPPKRPNQGPISEQIHQTSAFIVIKSTHDKELVPFMIKSKQFSRIFDYECPV
jgi:hypothetical protein